MKKKMLMKALSMVMVMGLLSGCGNAENGGNQDGGGDAVSTGEGTSADSGIADAKIALVLPGSIDDQSWNASNYVGAKAVEEEYGIKVDVVESCPVEDFDATFTEFGEKGYDLVYLPEASSTKRSPM